MGASASGIIFRREASALLILLWWAATASRCGMSDKALALTLFFVQLLNADERARRQKDTML